MHSNSTFSASGGKITVGDAFVVRAIADAAAPFLSPLDFPFGAILKRHTCIVAQEVVGRGGGQVASNHESSERFPSAIIDGLQP